MADFKTHITTSTVLGLGYGAAGYVYLGVPWQESVLAAGLCSVSGILPDLDSDSGKPVRESFALAAAIVPMMLVDRFERMGWSHELIVAVGGLIYILIRFGIAETFKRYTVHRGMWHSVPAAGTAGLIAYLLITNENLLWRLFMTFAVVFGFFIHLFLDELWAIDMRRGFRLKKSFGTALKFWGPSTLGNFSVYAKLVLLVVYTTMYDPVVMDRFKDSRDHSTARDTVEHLQDTTRTLLR